MKENAYDLLLYIYEEYVADGTRSQHLRAKHLADDLMYSGYSLAETQRLVGLYSRLVEKRSPKNLDSVNETTQRTSTMRFFTVQEYSVLGRDGVGFFHTLLHANLISLTNLEVIIDAVDTMKSDEPIDLEQLKWLTHLVLRNENSPEMFTQSTADYVAFWGEDFCH